MLSKSKVFNKNQTPDQQNRSKMKKTASLLIATFAWAGLSAQTLNVVTGNITYQIPAAQAGYMVYSDGTTLTILNKTFSLTDIDRMYVDDSEVTDNTVSVTYSDTEATALVAGNCMQYLDVDISGADVTINQDSSLSDELTYTLTGSSSDGSFYMDGDLKATIVLSDLSLTSTTTAPVNIQNGKRINIDIEGTNTLKDSSTSDGKGALMVNGHSEIYGSGTLNLYGYVKHAYWADEYVQLKKSLTGTINILKAASDGINVNQYFEQNGGTLVISGVGDDGIQVSADGDETGYVNIAGGSLTITATAASSKGLKADGDISINDDKSTPTVTITNSGAAAWDSDDSEVKGSACISSDANITIDAGEITLKATGKGGKGLKCDSVFTMNDGTLTISTSGTTYTYGNDSSSPKGIRVGIKASENNNVAVGNIEINGGTINVSCTGSQDGSEGIESKNTLYINGGTVTVSAYDDAINSAKNMYITGGTITATSSQNDALDSNANLYISGGTVMALGAASPETSIDAAEGYNVYFNGGTILGIGGSSVTPSSSSSQRYVSKTSSVSGGSTISVKSGSTTLCSFTIPSSYSTSSSSGGMGGGFGGMGGMGGDGYQVIVSCNGLTKGSSYTLTIGSNSSTVSAK